MPRELVKYIQGRIERVDFLEMSKNCPRFYLMDE